MPRGHENGGGGFYLRPMAATKVPPWRKFPGGGKSPPPRGGDFGAGGESAPSERGGRRSADFFPRSDPPKGGRNQLNSFGAPTPPWGGSATSFIDWHFRLLGGSNQPTFGSVCATNSKSKFKERKLTVPIKQVCLRWWCWLLALRGVSTKQVCLRFLAPPVLAPVTLIQRPH